MLKRIFVLGLVGVFVSALIAFSAPSYALSSCEPANFGDGGAALQGVLDGITTGPNSGTSSVNVTTDCLDDSDDSLWSISGSGGAVTTLIIELAGFANNTTFGIYDEANASNTVEIFAGAATTGAQAILSILNDGSVIVNFVDSNIDFAANKFGFYIDTTVNQPGVGAWFSDTSLNSDGVDHMFAYEGTDTDMIQILPFSAGLFGIGEFILAWEDLVGGGDRDYTDFVVIVESVDPMKMPEPGTLSLLVIGLAGLGLLRRRRKTAA